MSILLDIIKPCVLQSELNTLIGSGAAPKNQISLAIHVAVIVNEVAEIKDLPEMRNYLIRGGGLDKSNVDIYISDLYFSSTNQIN